MKKKMNYNAFIHIMKMASVFLLGHLLGHVHEKEKITKITVTIMKR